ncbi:MAG: DNA polymerase III subunit alpha [Nitrospinaceae bacterium]
MTLVFAFYSPMFVHMNCHSHYSLLAGADGIDALVQAAAAMGCPALALTDTNALYGAVAFYRSARSAGIRPVFGVEIDQPGAPLSAAGVAGGARAVLLAKDLEGFGEICRVVTDRHLRPDFSLTQCLKRCGRGVIVLCADTEVLRSVVRARGGGDIYVELTRFPSAGGTRAFRALLDFARRGRLPVAATNRVFFVLEGDWRVHRLLAAIRTNTTAGTLPPGAAVPRDCWMKPPREMARLFRGVPDAIRNTLRIAEQCEVELPIGEVLFPPFDLPPGETPSSYLAKLAHTGVKKLYHDPSTEVMRRLRHELRVIDGLAFAPYFLIVWDIVREARARGILTVGRGSAANSLVCRALGITEVDPIRHNLYFERFLNPERTDYPDIDIDFPWNRRDEMLGYVFEKYGRDRVALISTHVHFRGRSVLREVGKALGIPIPEIDAFTKRLPHFAGVSRLEEARQTIPECRDLPLEDEPYKTMIALGQRIEGFPRHLSIHCGGIVVCPFPITNRIPLQKTPKGFVVTQYDMYPVEDMGLLKIDLLAQKGLAVLADTVRDAEAHYGVRIDFNRIDPVRDTKTRGLIREGKTIGCFYIESPGMRNLLKKLRVDGFEMLTAASSIIRPGVADSGMMKSFIDRHNGREKVRSPHPRMDAILKDTFGVMIYQEDVIKVAHAIAGMSLGEADNLRKCMSKKRDWEDMENHRGRFLSGALGNGVSREAAEEIWRQIESFAGYAFCKAHSASFAVVSYQTAYLKAHYPAEFMAAVLSNEGGFYDACAYVEEARRMGLAILPPHVNHSASGFTAVWREETGRRPDAGTPGRCRPARKIRCDGIRVGLSQVKGLTHGAIRSILERRKDGPYVSLDNFLSRLVISDHETESLIRCGAFDGLGRSRPNLLWQLIGASPGRNGPRRQGRLGDAHAAAGSMFPASCSGVRVPILPEYSLREKLLAELECLDLTVSAHLLALYGAGNAGGSPIPAREIERFDGRVVTLVGWLVNSKRTRTVKNEFMKFLMLEDATETFEVTLFPKVYRRFGPLLYDRGPYIVKGRVERDGGCRTVTALWLGRLAG